MAASRARPALLVSSFVAATSIFVWACDDAGPTASEVSAPRPGRIAYSNGDPSFDVILPDSGVVNSTGFAFKITNIGTGGAIFGRTTSNGPAISGYADGIGHGGFFANFGASGTGNSVYGITNGLGRPGYFVVANAANTAGAVYGFTNGSGNAIYGSTSGTARAGYFQITNASNSSSALHATTNGTGIAGDFRITNVASSSYAVYGFTSGTGQAIYGRTTGTGRAGYFAIVNAANSNPAFFSITNGTGDAFRAEHSGPSGNIGTFRSGGANRARIDKTGKGFFNGGTQNSGADLAEAFAVEGTVDVYEPGDVLVISTRTDRTMQKSSEPYSTRVAGVYATKPGVLLTDTDIDTDLADRVPLGMVGVIPTKVSAENGPIQRGDLLVTSRTPGHAMKATPKVIEGMEFYPQGAILGKALEPFAGTGTGRILVLVNVK